VSESDPFADLIRRVGAGDAEAAAELVRQYEPAIRRAVRIRLPDARLRRLLNASDVCQSVLAGFFARAALGQYDLDSPEQLLRLLTGMAHNKLANQATKERAARRDHRRLEAGSPHERELAAAGLSPSDQVALQELVHKLRELLSPEERRLAELRSPGGSWAETAAQVGGSPEALRKQLARAVERAAQHLGLDEVPHE
jgi:RNA polymerase sigma-70 factor (ECF subfamily)